MPNILRNQMGIPRPSFSFIALLHMEIWCYQVDSIRFRSNRFATSIRFRASIWFWNNCRKKFLKFWYIKFWVAAWEKYPLRRYGETWSKLTMRTSTCLTAKQNQWLHNEPTIIIWDFNNWKSEISTLWAI